MSLKTKTKLIIIFDIVLFFFCLLGLYHNFNKAGLEAEHHITFKATDNQVIVRTVIDSTLEEFFTEGDIIISLQGRAVKHKYDIEFIFDGIIIGDPVSFRVLRQGREINFTMAAPPYYNLLYLFVQSFVSMLFLFLGVIAIYNQPEFDVAKIWHWASLGTAVIISCTWGNYSILPFNLGYVLRILFFAGYTLVPVTFFHLSLIFPRKKTVHLKTIIYPLYIFSGLIFLIGSISWTKIFFYDDLHLLDSIIIPFNINRGFFALAMFAAIGNIIHSYFTVQEEFEKKQLRLLILGLSIGPPCFVLFWQIPQLFGYDAIIAEEFIVLIMIAIPVSFYISIIKYHIFDIDLFIKRSTVYVIVAILLFLIYATLIVISTLLLGQFNIEASLISSIAAAVLTPIFFEPARRYFSQIVNRFFFRVQYNYRLAQSSITRSLVKMMDKESVAHIVVRQIDDLMYPEFFAFYIRQNEKWNLLASKNYNFGNDLATKLYAIIHNTNEKILVSNRHIEKGIDIKDLSVYDFKDMNNSLVIPFRDDLQRIQGMLILGVKKSGNKFTLEDASLFNTIAVQVGQTLGKIDLQQQLLLKNAETEKLKELSDLKSYFVSSISHDLQTPLTSIRMFAELLSHDKNLSADARNEYLTIIKGESERLARLINNVLDFSKIERGVHESILQPHDLNALLSGVLDIMKYQFDQYGFIVKINLWPEELLIEADGDKLYSVFINILSNSIKYSDKTKEIQVKAAREDKKAVIYFSDKGVGIETKEQDNIFETFYRSPDEKIKSMGGAGLGLTLVQKITEEHNGSVQVKSEKGQGSVFILSFPLYSVEQSREDV